jgi:hypothetical protein
VVFSAPALADKNNKNNHGDRNHDDVFLVVNNDNGIHHDDHFGCCDGDIDDEFELEFEDDEIEVEGFWVWPWWAW